MANTIKIKRSTITDTPASLAEGELAFSEKSNNLFIGANGGTDVVNIGGKIGVTVQAYDANIVSDATYVATDKNFTATLKTKLDGISAGANKYAHPTNDGDGHVPSTGITNNGKVLKAGATAGTYAWATEYSYTHPNQDGDKHIPTGGTNGQVLSTDGAGAYTWVSKNNYSLPTASATVKGGIKVGTNLSINASGELNASNPTEAGSHLSFTGDTLNVITTVSPENAVPKISILDADNKFNAMGYKVGRHTADGSTPFGMEAYDHYAKMFRKLQWVPNQSFPNKSGWSVESADGVCSINPTTNLTSAQCTIAGGTWSAGAMNLIAHEGNKVDFYRPITNSLTSTSETDCLSALAGKSLLDKYVSVDNDLNAVGSHFENKLSTIQDTNFDFVQATTDVQDEMLAIWAGNLVATSQQVRDHLNEMVSGYKRGDIDGDGDIDFTGDALNFIKYVAEQPSSRFSYLIIDLILQPMYDNPSTWTQYHSAGYFKTDASLPASQVTESTTKKFITASERTKWNNASTWYSEMTTADTDTVMNKWLEVQTAVSNLAESDSLLGSASAIDGGTF